MTLVVLFTYLATVIPSLFMLLSWMFTDDPMRCWRLQKAEMIELFWIALALAVGLPFMICGVLYTLFGTIQFVYVYLNQDSLDPERLRSAVFMLFMLVFSVPSAVIGSIVCYRKWQVVRQFFGFARPDFVEHENR